jgi:hypothetical protein
VRSRSDVPTRNEVRERLDGHEKNMDEREISLDEIASDVETVRRTLEGLDFRGTSEGAEEVEGAIENAEDVTERAFDTGDEQLERIQQENQDFESELLDRKEVTESDVTKVSDAASGTKTSETIRELEKARDAAVRDISFLQEHLDRARDAREKSDAAQEGLRGRVHGGGRRS